ncbi:hypothetical protein [Lactiplantibacillus songbeiensis]|uniref:Uncharacterized protein n=1 Tax=Lactiplantibacillus songbeiensis TaxID=2559920 RepID=A0ABW4C3W0_9LACO|nr:hypothetical protein [Lactiplantibacillus songbeiensis]
MSKITGISDAEIDRIFQEHVDWGGVHMTKEKVNKALHAAWEKKRLAEATAQANDNQKPSK